MRRADRDEQFGAFYAHEADRLHRLALLLIHDRDRAQDLAQDALLNTYRAWHRIRTDPGAYARRTLVNLARNSYRRRALEARHRLAHQAPSHVESRSESVIDALWVASALQVLSPLRRATIVLRFYEDMSEQAIADLLDRPLGTVKSDIHRALNKLRPVLDAAYQKEKT